MAQTRIAQVIDALVAGLGATTGFRASTVDVRAPVITVWDGPDWSVSDDHAAGGNVVIGWSRNQSPSATVQQEAGPIAATNRPRDEIGQITCLASAQRHSTTKGARTEAVAIMTAVANFCRSDPSLGINTSDTIGGVRTLTYVTAGSLVQFYDRGSTCELEFTITYKTRV